MMHLEKVKIVHRDLAARNVPEAFKQEADDMIKIKVSHTGENVDQTANNIYTRWQDYNHELEQMR